MERSQVLEKCRGPIPKEARVISGYKRIRSEASTAGIHIVHGRDLRGRRIHIFGNFSYGSLLFYFSSHVFFFDVGGVELHGRFLDFLNNSFFEK